MPWLCSESFPPKAHGTRGVPWLVSTPLMLLTEAIVGLAQKFLTEDNHWYGWPINDDLLPEGITLPNGSLYHRNVSLKRLLNERLENADDQQKVALVNYYISDWGRIPRNSHENIRRYALDAPEQLISLGKKGIASWSKALCIRDPNAYPIYDARVAVALNALQAINNDVEPQLFPAVPSRKTSIVVVSNLLRQYATQHGWARLNAQEFYRHYIHVISIAASNLRCPLYTVEMLLFAKAEDLSRVAFRNGPF